MDSSVIASTMATVSSLKLILPEKNDELPECTWKLPSLYRPSLKFFKEQSSNRVPEPNFDSIDMTRSADMPASGTGVVTLKSPTYEKKLVSEAWVERS